MKLTMFKQISTFVYLLLFIQNIYGQDIRFRKITSTQGLSHNTVYAVTQDEQGFMWFGTREGLNRFDGRNLKSYYITTTSLGKSTNQINALLSHQHDVYIGTNQGLYRYDSLLDRLIAYPVAGQMPAINSLLKVQQAIYVGTPTGLFRIRGQDIRLQIRGFTKAMCSLSNHRLLLAIGQHIVVTDTLGNIERTFTPQSFPALKMNNFTVFHMHRDPKDRIWLATSLGLYNYDDQKQRFSQLHFATKETPENSTVRSVVGASNQLLYIGTEDGLYIHNLNTGESSNYQQSFMNNPKKLNDRAIYSTFIGKDGSVWLGTYFGGINYIPVRNEGFQNVLPSDQDNGLSGKAVSQFMEDSLHRIWIATEDGGISIYHPKKGSFEHINKNSRPFYLNTNNVHAIHNDGYGNIWVGTFLGGLHRFNLHHKTTTIYTKNPSDPHSLSNNQVYAVYRDSRGTLWVGTQQGLNRFDYKTGQFSLFEPAILGDKFIYDLTEDKHGDLWFCSRQHGIYRYNPLSKSMRHYTNQGQHAPLLSNQIISVYKDRNQQLWFGTLDGGVCVYNATTDSFKHYTTANGLANNNVYGILEDDAGMIWLSTNLGISKCDPHTGKIINYDNKYGLSTNQFNFKSFLKASDGTFYFGNIYGFCYFNPLLIETNNQQSALVLTDFQLFNKSVQPDTNNAILKHQIAYTTDINLSYNQNVFTISYIAINYVHPGSTKYAYYLEGFEDQWNYVGNKTNATYTNLSPGSYVFHVKTLSDAGGSTLMERKIHIRVAPPYYRSTLAYILYILLLSGTIWIYTRFVRFLHQKQTEIQLAHIEKEKTEALTQHRINFFTFISHEFKTPLTLILAAIDKFVNEKGLDLKKHAELAHIKKNASKLFTLIHQLAEFRKVEGDHLSVHLTRSDLVKFVQQVISGFDPIIADKGLALHFESNVHRLDVFFDTDKVETILSNVLSNAIKHTSDGSISVSMQTITPADEDMIILTVSDTGTGVSAKDLHHIFSPFYRSTAHKDMLSTGIGLALVDNLVKSLHGKIDASSTLGQGTTITIHLPIFRQLHTPRKEENNATHNEPLGSIQLPASSTARPINMQQYTLLIAEDNRELLKFLSQHFQENYQVIHATNGAVALKKMSKTLPDIIISDIKMPKLDGLQLCLQVKQDKRYAHIPIILLSDSQDDQIKVDGLDIGADAYMGKPFNLKELELLVTNMIQSRVKLREHVIDMGSFATDTLPSNNKDQAFLAKLSHVLEQHYSNPEISIEDIAREMNTSRTSLHLNLKKTLHKSATELLNEFRLKKALIMLENDMPIGEIAYYCGYREANYFSRIFKKHYQLSPLKYKETHFENR